ncbi:alpha adducin [Tieghemostelium lacteum]|uniref:Alpha adducin n=1 Tax=Tieghemostelium lacteum TaxID=361077 RepID=A0A152A3W2_TIELA|nr:alpha adducin [Tieghemostelium lacteum]|eukprot:KYR00899.1 alpha adducin [Tieghemostelium lacteum]
MESIDITTNSKYSGVEYEIRVKLAAAYRICAYLKWDEVIYNHLTARIPGTEHILLNPFGMRFDEITASSLVKIDMDGNIIDKGCTDWGINKTAHVIHTAIHKARPDILSTMHTHEVNGVAVACMKEGLIPISQNSMLINNITYHDYESISVDISEQERIAKDLGPTSLNLVLRNHGLLTCGRTIEEAFYNLYVLTKACEIQVQVMSMVGGDLSKLNLPPKAIQDSVQHIAANFNKEGFGVKEFNALYRIVEKLDRSFKL